MSADKYMSLFRSFYKKCSLQVCFNESDHCSEKIIKSHTIQNSYILDQLVRDNHIYMIDFKGDDGFLFEKIGRNNASVFTGFCSHHDNELFSPIDFSPDDKISTLTEEQKFLFHYRTLCREYWAKLNAEKVFSKLSSIFIARDANELIKLYPFIRREEIDWDDFNIDILSAVHQGQVMGRDDLRKLFESMQYQILNKKFHLTQTYFFQIDSPCNFAVSSYLGPVCDFKDNIVNNFESNNVHGLSLNIFPHEGKTNVVFGWHKKSSFLKEVVKQLVNSDTESQKVLLSKFVLAHCENVVYSYDAIDALDEIGRKKILDVMAMTTITPYFTLRNIEDVSLFN